MSTDVSLVPVGCPGDQSSALAETARSFRAGRASPEELSLAFVGAVLFCPIVGDGVCTVTSDDRPYMPMYTSESRLARGHGPCEWFSGVGADLVRVTADGCGIVVDPGTDSEVVLESWAIHPSGAAGDTHGDEEPQR